MDKQIWWLWDIERAECLKVQDLSKQDKDEKSIWWSECRVDLDLLFTAFLCLLYVALRLLLNVQSETSIAEILLLVPAVCFGLGVPVQVVQVVSMMPSVCCGGNPKGRHGGGFLSAVKPPAQRKQGGRCWCYSPHGFHCGSLVTLLSPQSLSCIPVVPPKEGQVLATKCIAFCHGDNALPRFAGISLYPGFYWPTTCSERSFSLLSHTFPLELSLWV